MFKDDCFAFRDFRGKCSCNALILLCCNDCAFYKTKSKHEEDVKRAEQRLESFGYEPGVYPLRFKGVE